MWIVICLVVLNGGWMLFDGARALIVGEYMTPKTGTHAGQLGPWSIVVKAVGIDPNSTLMKSIFVIYGLSFLIVLTAFVLGTWWGWWGMMVVAVLGLWHIPFGTIINIAVIALL